MQTLLVVLTFTQLQRGASPAANLFTPMKNLSIFICLCLLGGVLNLQAGEIEDFKAALQKISVTPFAGSPGEYQAFSQNLGDSLTATADQMLAQSELTPEDKRFAILMKYWGLVRKYGVDRDELGQRLENFAAGIEDVPGMTDLYKTIMENLYFSSQPSDYSEDTPAERAEAFIKHRDRFIPFMEKYCAEEDDRQLTYIMGQVMQMCDNDGSFGLVESTVEKLMPLLKKQETSRREESHSKMVQGMLRRVQLTGNEMEYKGVSTNGELIDVKDHRGKVIFLNMSDPRDEKSLAVHKKLYDTLHNSGLVMIYQDNVNDSREVARKKAEDAKIPWIMTCRMAHYEKNLEDYYQNWGLTRALFLIGRDGVVIHSWSMGFCPAACEELKKLFPEQADVLTEIAAELTRQEEEAKAKRAEQMESQKSSNPLVNELNEMLISAESAVAPQGALRFPDVLTPQIRAQVTLELTSAILSFPEIGERPLFMAIRHKLDALESLTREKLKDHPEMDPLEAHKELQQAADELERLPNVNLQMGDFFHAKMSLLSAMLEYLNKMEGSKVEYAKDIHKRWVELNRREIERASTFPPERRGYFYLTQYNDFHFTPRLIDAMDEIDEDGSLGLVASLCDDLATLLDKTGSYELHETAERLRGIQRRTCSVGQELEFECILMSGEKINVKDLRGKIVLVNFWATWCGPCVREFPNMKTQYEKYKPKGYEMIALSIDAELDLDAVTEFQKANDYPWLVGSLVKSKDTGLTDYRAYYGIQGVPTTFLLGRDGKVLFRTVGSDDDLLNQELEKAFAE